MKTLFDAALLDASLLRQLEDKGPFIARPLRVDDDQRGILFSFVVPPCGKRRLT